MLFFHMKWSTECVYSQFLHAEITQDTICKCGTRLLELVLVDTIEYPLLFGVNFWDSILQQTYVLTRFEWMGSEPKMYCDMILIAFITK